MRTTATSFLTSPQIINELESLRFSVESLAETFAPGTHERENAMNISRGIRQRLNYVLDSLEFTGLAEESKPVQSPPEERPPQV